MRRGATADESLTSCQISRMGDEAAMEALDNSHVRFRKYQLLRNGASADAILKDGDIDG